MIAGIAPFLTPAGAQSPESTGTEGKPDFAREVLPILSNKCFVCHGPDTQKNFKLTSFAEATKERDGVRPIDPYDAANSEILARLHHPSDPMPPNDAEKQLTDSERDTLTRWVQSGGEYAAHWAYVVPQKSSALHSIDEFIHADLKQKNISFAPEASKSTLARRVALVLTGLPPEPEELATYMADDSAVAYENLVLTLLDSPRYGEHQARYWLDAVRYGDTHGLHLDNKRGIYPYRDWVIQALNDNLPMDDFITWQIAGDLLPDPTLEQQVATGYVRLNPSTAEGGAIPAEFQAKNNFDRVETLGTAFLGMSLLCARCHTHKYDPVPQEEYYRLMAFFNSTAEFAMDGNSYDYKPNVLAPKDIVDWKAWRTITQQIVDEAGTSEAAPENLFTPLEFSDIRTEDNSSFEVLDDESIEFTNEGFSYILDCTTFEGTLEGFRLEVFSSEETTSDDAGPIESSDIILNQFKATLKTPEGDTKNLAFRRVISQSALPSTAAESIIKEDPGEGWAISRAQDESVVVILELKREVIVANGATVSVELIHPEATNQLGRFKLSAVDNLIDRGPKGDLERLSDAFTTTLVAKEGEPRDTYLLDRGEYNLPVGDPLDPDIISVVGPMPPDAPKNRLGLAAWLISRENSLVSRVLVNRLWQQTFGDGLVRTPEDFGLQGEQPTHPELLDWLAVTLHETDWDLKAMIKRMVMSQTFRQSSRFRDDVQDPANRLFARGPSYRLDAEVLRDLNLWASGLLDPQMGGEGVKPYQPGGMWKALAHPGSNTKEYVQDEGSKLYRRSLYVYWKRTSPHPMMTLFDAPNRETSCVRRSRSNTALQSLALLNETQRIETARALAERVLREEDNDRDRLDFIFKLVASRVSSSVEAEVCFDLLSKMKKRYRKDSEDAERLLAIGDTPRDESLNTAKHAAWTQLAATILASDRALLLY
jgi:mono/diheme cytochrome c family protein